jgi:hypothetical protein
LAITRARTSSVAQGPSTKRTLLADNPVILGGSYESIATYTVTGASTASFTLSSIPSTYTHLQLRCFVKLDAGTWIPFRVNGDTNAQRSTHNLRGIGSGSGNASSGLGGTGEGNIALVADVSQWGGIIIDILDYANTNKNKTTKIFFGFDNNGSGSVGIGSVLHYTVGTSAVTSVGMDITQYGSGAKFVVGSTFALYGIK